MKHALIKRLIAVAVALLGMTFLAVPTPASAATPVSPALSCPDYHVTGQYAICFYDSDNFNNIIDYYVVNSIDCGTSFILPTSERNRANSVRNRTPCNVGLEYYCGSQSCTMETMAPFTEDPTIAIANVLDWLKTS